jgi:hypothetical protein
LKGSTHDSRQRRKADFKRFFSHETVNLAQ